MGTTTPPATLSQLRDRWATHPNLEGVDQQRSRLTAWIKGGSTLTLERFGPRYYGKLTQPSDHENDRVLEFGSNSFAEAIEWAEAKLETSV